MLKIVPGLLLDDVAIETGAQVAAVLSVIAQAVSAAEADLPPLDLLDAMRAALRGIADGRILVELESLGGGATCCVTRQIALALEGGQLVEVADPGVPDAERTSQAEPASPG